MKRYTGIKVIAILAVIAAVVFFAIRFSEQSLGTLQKTVMDATRPDVFLTQLESVDAAINGAESGVRAFAISHDEDFLVAYHQAKKNLGSSMDSLDALAGEYSLRLQLSEFRRLAEQKLEVYEELMLIGYSEIFDSALVEIAGQMEEVGAMADSATEVSDNKRSFLQKLFSTGPSRQELQARIDSALQVNRLSGEKARQARSRLSRVQQRQSQLIAERVKKELAVLEKDKRITAQIVRIMADIKTAHADAYRQQAREANANALAMVRNQKYVVGGGALIILLLTALVLIDIVKNERQRKVLFEARQQAERFALLKEEFLASMSHEIRTPLTSILGFTGRMARTALSEKQSYYVRNIEISSEHLLGIVNDILDISRIDSGKLVFEKTSFSPAAVIGEVCSVLQIKASEKGIRLVSNTYGISDTRVMGDPMRLRQVLFNLVGNAIKFTDKGHVSVKATLATPVNGSNGDAATGTLFEFRVTDTGAGIPRARLNTLFDQYAQADESISRKYGGTGLGLSICKKIIEQQGGRITVESEVGRGSEFVFSVPFEITHEPTPEKQAEPVRNLNGLRVLLAEDVEVNRALQDEMLTALGAVVWPCADGREALDAIEDFQPDVVLMDIQMPRMNGLQAIRELRAQWGTSVPVAAMTANARIDDIEAYKKAGFNAVLIKPFREKELVSQILKLLGKTLPAAGMAQGEMVPTYDLQELKNASRGNNDFVARMLKLFIVSTNSILEKSTASATGGDWDELAALVHRLIPSCRQLSVNSLSDKLEHIESQCLGDRDATVILSLLAQSREIFDKLRVALEREITMLSRAPARMTDKK